MLGANSYPLFNPPSTYALQSMLEAVKTVYLAVSHGRDRLLRLVDLQRALSHRLLAVAGKVEVVVARRKPLQQQEKATFGRLGGVLAGVDRGSELQLRVDRLIGAQGALGDAGEGSSSAGTLSGADTAKLLRQLEFSHKAIDQLFVVVRRDARDLLVMRNHLATLVGL
jgi:hypothetical protein